METDANSVLEFLLSKGQIPSFSFPLDSTVFAAEVKGKKEVKHMARFSRDTKLAISELAPGQQRTVNGKKLELGGLYFEYTKDKVNRAQPFFDEFNKLIENRVSMCMNEFCGWVSENKRDNLTDEICPICINSDDPKLNKKNVKTYLILKPEGFSPICVPHANGAPQMGLPIDGNTPYVQPIFHKQVSKKPGRFSGKAQLPAPDINDISKGKPLFEFDKKWNGCKIYVAQESSNEGLGTDFVLINSGPDGEGFEFCERCGASLHEEHLKPHYNKHFPNRHYRPYIISHRDYSLYSDEERKKLQHGCPGSAVSSQEDLPIALGLRFRTDLILFRFSLNPDGGKSIFDWSKPEFHGALMAFRDSLQVKLVQKLGLMNREISAGFRLVSSGVNNFVDIFLYDSVSGGAGLVSQVKNMNKEEMLEFLHDAVDHLDGRTCLEKKACSRACVGCLLDFKNKRDHDIINRPLGWSLSKFFQSNRTPCCYDYGLNIEGESINRLDNAIDSYSTFTGNKSTKLSKESDDVINTPSGKKWKIVSPLFDDDFLDDKMRIDTLEIFPEEIISDFDFKKSNNQRADFFSLD